MCGIAGIVNVNRAPSQDLAAAHRMGLRMYRRGPDDEGYMVATREAGVQVFAGDITPTTEEDIPFFPSRRVQTGYDLSGDVFFAHRRLSIIDLSPSGHQPMSTADQRYWMVYNGEIYNFQELAADLRARGIDLLSTGDSEVLLYAYREWGPQMLQRLNGMFALAIWDQQEKTLFCARDRIGIKPFYYTWVNGQFVFASDLKTIIASGIYTPEVDTEGLYYNLSYGVAPRPMTILKDVYALEQAHWMRINTQTGDVHKERYWQVPLGTQQPNMTEQQAVELVQAELEKAVERRLIADVKVGTFMSGGIDSTMVSAIASGYQPGIQAYTLGFQAEADDLNELEQAKATAAMHPIEHVIRIVDARLVLDHIDAIVDCYEEPFYSLGPNYVVSQLAADSGAIVVLNGLGGDELFAGYGYYGRIANWQAARHLTVKEQLRKLYTRLRGRENHRLALADISTADRFHSYSHCRYNDYGRLRSLFPNPAAVQSFDAIERLHELYVGDDITFADDVEAVNYMDMLSYIGNHHVYRVDQFTMHFSIEGRFPLLDHELVEAAYRIPSKYKLKDGVRKHVLRKVAAQYIHPSCLSMDKKGFRFPVSSWVQGPLRPLLKEKLAALAERGYLNADEIHRRLNQVDSGRENYTQLWHLAALEIWLERMIDRTPAAQIEAQQTEIA